MKLRLPRPRNRRAERLLKQQIHQLVELAGARTEAADNDLVAGLVQSGMARLAAMRLVVFVPIAFGRNEVARLGVTLSPNVEFPNAGPAGRAIHRLDEFPEFRMAVTEIPALIGAAGFQALATRSADFNAVNDALVAGSDPKDLALTPTLVMWDVL